MVVSRGAISSQGGTLTSLAIQTVIENFQNMFAEPTWLPPPCSNDHQIQLKTESKPPYVRPYRYPYYQNEDIEKLVREMLNAGIIQPSQSHYFSPVFLVRKADGSWKMCIDYRALNKDTIKDNYHIPNIDELMNELYGAKIFAKQDLRSRYHHIKMKP